MNGVLIYDDGMQRFDIFSGGQSYGGLRCGETLEVLEVHGYRPALRRMATMICTAGILSELALVLPESDTVNT